ncbi:hypothetical protein BDR06DRAFT_952220 [Suillus hirtellus]|nr:hypothetical protein BDR06DRAFT_952220 [Suillus hirtellus]
MSGRKLNPEEQKLHQAALSSTDKVLTSKEAEKIVPDVSARTAAVNFLLGAGMLKVLSNAAGVISFRAVMKKEIEVKKDMSGEEAMVLGHIQASANEGIWTKHLKAKTELHQTVIDRCLKSLVQKQLVKAIKAVRHPTRKIYMLAHLEPSVELTGGPWYTDNELDTEFIKLLSTACLHYIRDRSFPKQSSKAQNEYRLYSISAAPSYPSAQHIQHFLSKSKITETQLGVEHVEMLLRVLELDGEIEKLPAFTASAWDATVDSDDPVPGSSSDSDSDTTTRKKRKRSSSKKKKERKTKTRKRRRTEESGSSSESDSDDDESEEEERQKRKRKRSKKEESDEEDHKSKKNKKRKSREKEDESKSEDSDDDDRTSLTSKRKRKGKGKKLDDSSDDDSESESDSDHRRSKSKSSSKLKSKKTKAKAKTKKPSSSSKRVKFESPEANDNINVGGAFVYRAIRQERVALGWSQAPCGRCPVFDFCRDKGPTNPQECVYYEEWLNFKGPGVVKVDV